MKKILLFIVTIVSSNASFGQNPPIIVEAESGILGSDFTNLNQAGVQYITIARTGGGQNPGDASRVASYTITFPAAGTYDLYARIRVNAGGANDDSFYYGNGFGVKSPTSDNDWITCNNLFNVGTILAGEIVSGAGGATTGVWKWIKLSEFSSGEPAIRFLVNGSNLVQTFQIGAREDGLDLDKFAFGASNLVFTVSNLDNVEPGTIPPPPFTPTGPPIAQGHLKFLGSAYSPAQAPFFENYWNQVTPENAGKWGSVESVRDVMNWTQLDQAYNFAKNQGYPFRFHVLVWGNQQPAWIEQLPPAEQLEEIEEWFAAVAARYPAIDFIDVVNEPLHDPPTGTGNGNYSEALGGAGTTGWDWIIKSFKLARQYFPTAKLMLNDYSIINSASSTTTYLGIINLLKDSALIDGVGEQGHAFTTTASNVTMLSNLNRLAEAGLPIHITELDIDGPTDQVQLQQYQRIFPLFWEHPSVTGITLWGWKPGHWRTTQGAPLALSNGAEKPALVWLRAYVNNNKPVITPSQNFTVSETAAINFLVGTVAATDADTIPTVYQNWQIIGGTGASLFSINSSTGQLSLTNNSSLDYEVIKSYSLLVTVRDAFTGSAPDTVTINITNENDNAPVIIPGQLFSVSEGFDGIVIDTVQATDADDINQSGFTAFQHWQITGGTGVSVFSIHPDSGVISVSDSTALDFETTRSYSLLVTVSDGIFTSEVQLVTINVTNVNEVPNAKIISSITQGFVPLSVLFDASTSSDPDEDELTYTWNFGDGATGSGITINHTYSVVGTYMCILTVTDPGGLSDTASIKINVSSGLKIQYRVRKNEIAPQDNHIRPFFQIVNTGKASVRYSELTIRYWYVRENLNNPWSSDNSSQQFWCDYAALGTNKVKGKFIGLSNQKENANYYMEVGFTSTASLEVGSNSGEIQTRFNNANWSNYDELNDYSYDASKKEYADWTHVTLYHNGNLVWGTEPRELSIARFISMDVSTELDSGYPLKLYPNPSSHGMFTVELDKDNFELNTILQVIDCTGKEIMHYRMDIPVFSNYPKQMSPGMYILRVTNKNGILEKKLAVN